MWVSSGERGRANRTSSRLAVSGRTLEVLATMGAGAAKDCTGMGAGGRRGRSVWHGCSAAAAVSPRDGALPSQANR